MKDDEVCSCYVNGYKKSKGATQNLNVTVGSMNHEEGGWWVCR